MRNTKRIQKKNKHQTKPNINTKKNQNKRKIYTTRKPNIKYKCRCSHMQF